MQTTLLGLAIAFIIALVAALVGPHFINWNQFRPQFEAEAAKVIGAPVRVDGALDARLLPTPTLRLSSVTVMFGPIPGANVQIKIGNPASPVPPQNEPTVAQATANSMTTVAQQDDVGGTVTFPVTSSASGRYILIWFTKLPPMAGQSNKYQADVFNVVVKGMG